MKAKRIVITGGPGSGKTSLIQHLQQRGFTCIPEISREVILKAQAEGIDQLFLEDPLLFSDLLLKGRIQQFEATQTALELFVFFDRGLPDVTAYMDYLGTSYPSYFSETCMDNRYDAIFLLPPWKEIYIQDNERYESFEQAEKIFHFLHQGYAQYKYEVHHVPVGTIEYRSAFILKKLETLF
ncbi:MAG: ATP-binding protein [Flavobacteriaceae bacterium]|nr:ATP-binding protein [Flavobacteriaceae bacterium]